MTKVDELGQKVLNVMRGVTLATNEEKELVNSLISAAHAEGVAEGAERERFRIWHYRDFQPASPNIRAVLIPVMAFEPISASVLAPTKEREKWMHRWRDEGD